MLTTDGNAALRDATALPPERQHFMQRYFFDIRDDDDVAPDEEGLVLPSLAAVREEGAHSLADLARAMIRVDPRKRLAIEVRDASGSVVDAARLQWTIQR